MADSGTSSSGESRSGNQQPEPLIRDQLAIERTVLANERTLLAYVRTGLALFLVGISFIHLPTLYPSFGGLAYDATGWVLVAAAILVLAVGCVRYRMFKARILDVQRGKGSG